jgi:hypothetical protein
MSNGANAICWGTAAGGSAATPIAAGTIKGCTNNTGFVTLLGCCAGASLTGICNTFVGHNAGALSTTIANSVFIGKDAGCCYIGGCSAIAIGFSAAVSHTSGTNNVAIGAYSGGANTATPATGSENVSLGDRTGFSLTTGQCNTLIGTCAGYDLTTGSRNVLIGHCVQAPAATSSCTLAIGFGLDKYWLTGNNTKAIKPGAGVIDCAGSCGTVGQYLWTTGANAIVWASSSPSDTRDKEILGPVPTALPVITQIEPITYKWKNRETNEAQEEVIYGFSAQQLQEVDPLLVDAQDEEHLRIFDKKIVPLLVQAVKELSAEVKSLRTELNEIKSQPNG